MPTTKMKNEFWEYLASVYPYKNTEEIISTLAELVRKDVSVSDGIKTEQSEIEDEPLGPGVVVFVTEKLRDILSDHTSWRKDMLGYIGHTYVIRERAPGLRIYREMWYLEVDEVEGIKGLGFAFPSECLSPVSSLRKAFFDEVEGQSKSWRNNV